MTKARFWLCKPCYLNGKEITYNITRGVQSVRKHMAQHHPKLAEDESLEDFKLANWFRVCGLDPSRSDHQHIIARLVRNTDFERVNQALRRWVVRRRIPFQRVDDPEFLEFLATLQPLVQTPRAINNRRTIARRVLEDLKYHQREIIQLLQQAPGIIHLAFDLWTSPNLHAVNGVVAHFANCEGTNCKLLLGLSPFYDSHEGVNIAQDVYRIAKTYGIVSKLGYFVLDNARNNDTAIDALAKLLNVPEASWAHQRRLRCMGHVISLVARSLLFGDRKDIYEAEDQLLKDSRDEVMLWQCQGPIRKIHNIVKWVRKSPQRHERWLKVCERKRKKKLIKPYRLELVQDQQTQWNSTYLIIDRAVELMAEVDTFIDDESNRYSIAVSSGKRVQKGKDSLSLWVFKNRFTHDDWGVLQTFQGLLQPLFKATTALQGDASAGDFVGVGYVLPTLECILSRLEDAKAEYAGRDTRIHALLEHGWAKADEYHCLMDRSPALAAAIVLDLRRKWHFINRQWKQQAGRAWLKTAKQSVRDLWQREYKDLPGELKATSTRLLSKKPPILGALRTYLAAAIDEDNPIVATTADEYDEWISKPRVRSVNPIKY